MRNPSRCARIRVLAAGIAAVLAFGHVQASGFQLKENSVKATGRADAGSAAVGGDTSVVVNNPAAMTLFDENAVQADIHAIDLTFSFDGGGTDAFGRPLTGGDGGDPGDLAAVPAMSVVFPLGDSGVTLGAMISAPFGLATDYAPGWTGRYHALESDVKIVDLTVSASLDVTDRFSVGLGVIAEHADVTLSNAIDFGSAVCRPSAATGGLPPPFCLPLGGNVYGPQQNDGAVEVTGDDSGIGFIAGLHLRPTDNLMIGLSHRSEIDHELDGTADFTVPPEVVPILAVGAPGQYQDTGVTAELTTPGTTTLSVAWQVGDRTTLMADASRTGWHSLRTIAIDFDNTQPTASEVYAWSDTMFYSVGGEFAVSDRLTLRAGLACDEAPVSDEHRAARLPDNDRTWLSIGATWALNDRLEVSGAYTRLQLKDPGVDIVSSSGSRLVGEYEGSADIFGVAVQYRF